MLNHLFHTSFIFIVKLIYNYNNTAASNNKENTAVKKTESKPANSKPKDSSASKDSRGPKPEKKERPAPTAEGTADELAKSNDRGGVDGHRRGKTGDRRRGSGPNQGGRGAGGEEGASKGGKPKREFERRSGTGRGREVSKGGRGAFGFGSAEQDAQDAEKNPASAVPDTEASDVEVAEPEPEPEPVDNTRTLDEYLALRKKATQSSTILSTKLAPRAVDSSELAGLRSKDDVLTDYFAKVHEKAAVERGSQRSTEAKVILDLGFKAPPPAEDDDRRGKRGDDRGDRPQRFTADKPDRPSSGRGRGGDRDGGRGRGGRGSVPASGRGVSGRVSAIDISDANAFPAL